MIRRPLTYTGSLDEALSAATNKHAIEVMRKNRSLLQGAIGHAITQAGMLAEQGEEKLSRQLVGAVEDILKDMAGMVTQFRSALQTVQPPGKTVARVLTKVRRIKAAG